MSSEIILYDLPSRGRCACWSYNPWKARLALNFKRLPYTTHWVEYPAIRPTFQSLGIPPNSPTTNPNAEYSIPALRLPSGRHVMDSLAIAHELEALAPEPSLHLDSPHLARTQAAMARLAGALTPIAIPRVPTKILNDASRAYFEATREKRFGMALTALAQSESAGEAAWEAARPGLEEVRTVLGESADGPYVLGEVVSFSDFMLAGLWHFYRRLDEGGDLFDRLMGYDASFRAHYEACAEWLEKDD